MTNVVLLVRNADKNDFGGAETYQVSLATILRMNGYEAVIVTKSERLREYAQKHGVAVIRGWWWSHQNWSGKWVAAFPVYVLWQLILTLWYIRLILRTKAGVLHIQSKDDFIAGTFAAWITGRKAIWTDHMDLRYIFQNVTRPLRNPVGKLVNRAAHFANHIILISDNEYRLVTAHISRPGTLSNIVIIKNGVIDHRADYENSSMDDTFSFCIASRIVKNKGIGDAIEAFKLLKANRPSRHVRLDIYGDGSDKKRFEAQAGDEADIVFHGHSNDVLANMNAADVFILPSYQEGFSIALLEATMLGKPIIASDVDSNGEIIEDHETGLLIPPEHPRLLADAMAELLVDDALREHLTTSSRRNFEKHFNLETIVTSQIMPLYEK